MISVDDIKNIVDKQNQWRSDCVNLIASENIVLPEAQKYYISDFMYRYAEGLPGKRYYNGTKYIDILEQETTEYFKKHFNADYVDTRPISGAIANLAVFSSLTKNNRAITNSLPSGGHITHNKMGTLGRILKFDIKNFQTKESNPYETDSEKTIDLIEEFKPDFIVFGKSMFLFPEPVAEIRKAFPELTIVYDSAHVFGLVYQGSFQKPIEEGADIITASTHKTFPGPQGGIIIAKNHHEIDRYMFPGIVSNHHLHRIPVLLMTAKLMDENENYKSLSERIIENAQYFAEQLYKNGFNVACKEFGFTKTHQVVVDVSGIGGGQNVADELEKHNIIVNKNSLPNDTSVINPSGIRIGVQEMTLKGWKKDEFKKLAEDFKNILLK